MKTKKFNKKLVFNKTTIVNLNNAEVNGIRGGSGTYCPGDCPTEDSAICQVSFFTDCTNDPKACGFSVSCPGYYTCGEGTCY
jgi:hypothetical protein